MKIPQLLIALHFLLAVSCEKEMVLDTTEATRQAKAEEVRKAKEAMKGKVIGKYTYRNLPFEDVKIKEVTNEGFQVTHKNGSATFLFEYMPLDVQQRYGYQAVDPATKASMNALNNSTQYMEVDEAKHAARAAEAKALKQSNGDAIRSEIASWNVTIPQMENQLAELRSRYYRTSYNRRTYSDNNIYNYNNGNERETISAQGPVNKKIQMDMNDLKQRIANGHARLAYLRAQLNSIESHK